MPFPLRTLEPLKLCRLEEAGGDGPAPGEHAGAAEGGGGRRRGAVPLFGTLEQVSSYALVSLLMQLSDLSRCAGDIFGGILSEADSLCHRNARLQRRLGALEELLARLDHRKVKIREYRPSPALGAPPGRCWGWALLCDLFKNRKRRGKLKHPRFSCPVLWGGGRPRSRRCPRAVAHPPWDTPALDVPARAGLAPAGVSPALSGENVSAGRAAGPPWAESAVIPEEFVYVFMCLCRVCARLGIGRASDSSAPMPD